MNVFLIIFAVLLFNLIIFVHELGHFAMAKMFGVKVNEFALGMGPKIFKIQKGDTLYSLRIFPIGGFCSMEGEDEESSSEFAFNRKAPYKKMIIIAMGAIMNIILGIIMIFILNCQQSVFPTTKISKFAEGSVSDTQGLQKDDEIISIDGYRTYSYKDLSFSLAANQKTSFDIDVKRGSDRILLKDVKFGTVSTESGKTGIQLDFYVYPQQKTVASVVKNTFVDTVSTIRIVWTSLIGLLTGRFSVKNMSGPVGLASAIGSATSEGLKIGTIFAINNIISMMAMITVNLGVFNLLPLPALDGGRLVFLVAEVLIGKSLSAKYEGWIHTAGFVLLIALMIFVTYSDIVRLIKGD